MNSLVDFLVARELRTISRKIELVVRAFAAVDMTLPILACSEEQQSKLNIKY